jgi:hypothetical protein
MNHEANHRATRARAGRPGDRVLGRRLRLQPDYATPGYAAEVQVILRALEVVCTGDIID